MFMAISFSSEWVSSEDFPFTNLPDPLITWFARSRKIF